MKKFASLLLALVMVLSLVACGNKPADDAAAGDDTEEIVIGVSLMDYQWEYFQDMAAAMRKVAAENGVTLIEADGGSDVAKQMKDIEDMIAAGKVKALVINAVSSAGIVPVIEEANAAGIPVITVDVQAEGGDVYAHVASDNKAIGATAAQDAVAYLESVYGEAKGTVACVGYPQISTMKDRAEGFCAEMAKYPNITVIDQSVVQLTSTDATNMGDDILTANPAGSLDVMFGCNAQVAMGLNAAVETAGRTDVMIYGVDEDEGELTYIANPDSTFTGTVVQYPTVMGRMGMEFAIKAVNGEAIENSFVATDIKIVNKENIEEFYKEKEAIKAEIADYQS